MSEETVKPGFNFIWAIENFSHALEKDDESITSPAFKMTASGEIIWRMHLYPSYTIQGTHDYISIFVVANGNGEISVECELSLLSENGKILKSLKANSTRENFCLCGWNNFIFRQDVLVKRRAEFLPKDILTVCCRLININSKSVEEGSLFARNQIGVQKTSINWSIQNFSKLQPKQKASILLESVSTQMELYFPAEVLEFEKLQIDISQHDITKLNLSICKISLLDVNGEVVCFKEDEHFFDAKGNKFWKFPQFITRNMLLSNRKRYLPRDILTLKCEFSVSVGVITSKIENYGNSLRQIVKSDDRTALGDLHISEATDQSHTLTQDLRQLYKDQTHSDMCLEVEDIKFPVHKSILSARSSVFRAMFQRDMTEKRTGVADIPDLNQDAVRRMLTFIYTDTVENLESKDCMDLYTAADKYDLQHLKGKCSSLLRSSINQSNVVKLLILADRHSDDSLKKHLQDFMLGREKEIFSTEEWKTLMKSNPSLALEVTQELLLQKCP